MEKQGIKTYSLEELTDKHIGKKGTARRDRFDRKLSKEIVCPKGN